MIQRDIFLNISPLDHRYYLSNKQVFDSLAEYLSEEATISYCLRVEIAYLKALVSDNAVSTQLDYLIQKIKPEEIYQEEEKTHHNIRALVNVLKKHVPRNISHLVHLGPTSADILDTAASLRYRDALKFVILPLLVSLEEKLISICENEAETPQIGRTHGQHGVPLTFGFALAEYVSRLGKSIQRLEIKSNNVRGKLSGAVGAYNSLSLITKDPMKLERDCLSFLDLKPSDHSTQIVEPEYLLEMLLEINTAFGVIANLADDLRNLQRSEIGEVQEGFSQNQVGSSTMPQKRNPWNSEHVKSLWKAFSPRVITFFMDQISEHQRDLTNSASARFVSSYIAGFAAAVKRMGSVLDSLYINRRRMAENLQNAGDMMLAEAAYILLAKNGETQAHERIKLITLECEKGESLREKLQADKSLWVPIAENLKQVIGIEPDLFFSNSQHYTGAAREKTLMITRKFAKIISEFDVKDIK